jgi:mycothiol system anti-sigma-R factor
MTEHSDHGQPALPCASVLTLAYEYLDGEVAPDQKLKVEGHLARCPGCREHIERERSFRRSLRAGLAGERCPEVVRERISEAMRSRRQSRDTM